MTNEASNIIDVLEKASTAAADDAANPNRKMGSRPMTVIAPAPETEPAAIEKMAPDITAFEANAIQNAEVSLAINRNLASAIEGTIEEAQRQLSGIRRVIASHEAFLSEAQKAGA